jgi:hypothetical protein
VKPARALTSPLGSLSFRVSGPFGCPWLTFSAIISVVVAAIAAVIWAVVVKFDREDQ